jgi:hypothetical protein
MSASNCSTSSGEACTTDIMMLIPLRAAILVFFTKSSAVAESRPLVGRSISRVEWPATISAAMLRRRFSPPEIPRSVPSPTIELETCESPRICERD